MVSRLCRSRRDRARVEVFLATSFNEKFALTGAHLCGSQSELSEGRMGVIAIDWSGAKRPKNKICIAEANNGSLSLLEPMASREQALKQVLEQLALDSRTIVGLDFAFSMPAWFLYSLGVSSVLELWKVVTDKGEGWLQECASPFWGRPKALTKFSPLPLSLCYPPHSSSVAKRAPSASA
jgi:hypothetical protein